MRRSTVLNLHKIRFGNIFFKNKILILMIAIFLIGTLIPCVTCGSGQIVFKFGNKIYETYKNQHFDLEFFSVFSNNLIFNLVYLCCCFTIGTTMLGVVLAPALCLISGGLFGFLASYVCYTYQLKGIAFNAIILIPGYILSYVTIIFALKEAIKFSFAVSSLTFNLGTHNELPCKFKGYCLKFLLMIFAIIISALLDATFSCSFIKLFEF